MTMRNDYAVHNSIDVHGGRRPSFGAKTMTEAADGGWSLTGSRARMAPHRPDAHGDAGSGDAITCTYTNKKDATLTIVKDAQPNAAQDFAFTTSGPQLSGFLLDDDGDGTLSNTKVFTISGDGFGAKTVTESETAGWSLTDITCSEGTDAGRTATVEVDPGDDDHLYLHEQEGRDLDDRQGRAAQQRAGLRVHDDRLAAVGLLARR